MKKLYIILISIIAVVILIAAGIFLFQGNNTDNKKQMPDNQNSTGLNIDSLAVGNWVSVMAEKGSDGTYAAEMINVCDDKDSCSNNQQGGNGQTPPSGTAPTGEAPTGTAPTGDRQKSTADRSMLSGTITEVGTSAITLELDTGETATVTISDSTRIVER